VGKPIRSLYLQPLWLHICSKNIGLLNFTVFVAERTKWSVQIFIAVIPTVNSDMLTVLAHVAAAAWQMSCIYYNFVHQTRVLWNWKNWIDML